jgi:hypothetical protein
LDKEVRSVTEIRDVHKMLLMKTERKGQVARYRLDALPAALGPGVYSASNRNEYRKH